MCHVYTAKFSVGKISGRKIARIVQCSLQFQLLEVKDEEDMSIKFHCLPVVIMSRSKLVLLGHISLFFYLVTLSTTFCLADDVKNNQSSKLSILTSFSPDFYLPFIQRYQERNPTLQIQVLNKKTTSAMADITRGNNRNFDIFWSSSPDAFSILKDAKCLFKTGYIPSYPPISTKQPIPGDFDSEYFNFALSGVGYMWNKNTLMRAKVKPPESWQDLTDSRFYGQLAMSTPSRSGTTHLIVESLLQNLGWDAGWQYLIKIAANFETITARSFSVPDGVASGRFGAGLVIDFLATAKMNVQQEIDFSYGDNAFLMPAGVAALKNGRNVEESVKFIDFLLSIEGQEILLRPSIGRMPISKAVFSSGETAPPLLVEYIDKNQTIKFNTELSKKRYLLINTLFDQLITYRLLEYRRVWKKLLTLEKTYGAKSVANTGVRGKLTTLLGQVPVTENQSLSADYNKLFRITLSKELSNQKRAELKEWEIFQTTLLSKAEHLLREVELHLSGRSND